MFPYLMEPLNQVMETKDQEAITFPVCMSLEETFPLLLYRPTTSVLKSTKNTYLINPKDYSFLILSQDFSTFVLLMFWGGQSFFF